MAITYPEPLKTWNKIVIDTVKRLAIHVESINPSQLVGQVKKTKNIISGYHSRTLAMLNWSTKM